ncbi:cytochrome c-type biogenesis CcmF C-terminal domain-containing protein, partial [Rosenbergiella collisarenosi]
HRHRFWQGLTKLSRSHWGMVLGHLGVAVTVIGIAFSTQYSVERDVRMKAGDSVSIHDYQFTFRGVKPLQGANYSGGSGVIDVTHQGKTEAV